MTVVVNLRLEFFSRCWGHVTVVVNLKQEVFSR